MKKTAFLIMLLTIVAKIFGFLKDIVLSYFYGASNITDAYLISMTIPVTILSLVGAGITAGYIPIYNSIMVKENENEAIRFTNNLINIIAIISTFIVLIGIIWTKPIVLLFASGFDGPTINLAVRFTRISIYSVYFPILIYIFKGYLQINGEFYVPALITIPFNIIIIVTIFISVNNNTVILSIGSVIAIIAQIIFLIPSIKKHGYKYYWVLNFKSRALLKMIVNAIPVIIGVSVNQINILVDRTLASRIAIGGISALEYSNKLNLFIQGIFVISITSVMYPVTSSLFATNEIQKAKKIISESINIVFILIIPVTIGSMIFSKEIISMIYGRGAFDKEAILLTSTALFFYSMGMVGFGIREVLSRVFYSIQNTKTPMINAAFGMVLNIILNIVLSRFLGIGGLALATSIAATFTTILLFISLRKKIGSLGIKQMSISFLKILFASFIMGGLAKLSFNYLTSSLSQNLSLLFAIGVGSVSYFVIIYFMKIEDVDVIVGAIKKKFGRGAV